MKSNHNQQRPDGRVDLPPVNCTAICDYCSRREELDDEIKARAWLFEHIRAEHGNELPDYKGVGNDE